MIKMKYTFLTIALAISITACNNEAGNESTNEGATTKEAVEMEAPMAEDVPAGSIDPVCEMVKGDDWEEYSVNGTDTTWFCSHVCKGAYESHPEKYNKEG